MRRKEKEITELAELEMIISRCQTCRLALAVDNQPYLVPLCFGYDSNTLYFHSAKEGQKLDMIDQNPNICFQMDTANELVKADKACDWGLKYESIIGFGIVEIINDPEEKIHGLNAIMKQYSDETWEYPQKQLDRTLVYKVKIREMTGKKSGY